MCVSVTLCCRIPFKRNAFCPCGFPSLSYTHTYIDTHTHTHRLTHTYINPAGGQFCVNSRCSHCRPAQRRPHILEKFTCQSSQCKAPHFLNFLFSYPLMCVCVYVCAPEWTHPLLCTQASHCHPIKCLHVGPFQLLPVSILLKHSCRL